MNGGRAALVTGACSGIGLQMARILATATGLYDPSVVPVDLARRIGVMMDAEAVARAGIDALFRGEAESVPGALTRAMAAAAAVTPQPFIDWVRRRAPWLPQRG